MTINLSTANEFIARHIGPRQEDEQQMLASLGFDSLEALSASVIPESIKGTSVLGLEDGLSEAEALARIKAIASQNQLFKTYIGHTTTAQPPRKPGLVHRLHALPGRNFPGPPGSAAEFPDPDQRPHRPADRQRFAARRSHRRRRSHDLLQAPEQEQGQ
jgi:hypothetical protein